MKAGHASPWAVVVVNCNTRDLLRTCLESVRAASPDEAVVVDNASSDGSSEMVEAEFPWVTLCRNDVNVGYGSAANQAIAACTARYVLLLNSDTVLQHSALSSLAAYLDRKPRAAVLGPRLVNLDGTLQASCYQFPIPLAVFLEFSSIYRVIRRIPAARERILRTSSHTEARPVPWVVGAALAIRREAFEEVGGFDESFFMYFEEVDLCYRLSKAGWEVHLAPVTDVLHVGGASTQQRRAEMDVQLFTSLAQFYRRHYSRVRLLELVVLVECIALAKLVRDHILIRFARSAQEQTGLAGNLIAWRRVLSGQWLGERERNEYA